MMFYPLIRVFLRLYIHISIAVPSVRDEEEDDDNSSEEDGSSDEGVHVTGICLSRTRMPTTSGMDYANSPDRNSSEAHLK